MQLVNGTALTGRLLKSADDLGVEIRVSTPARHLLTDGSGKVTGAVVAPRKASCRSTPPAASYWPRRVPQDVQRRKELFPKTPTGREHWTLAPKETTGDGITWPSRWVPASRPT
jgi:phytoene dehydrogenase-like protein